MSAIYFLCGVFCGAIITSVGFVAIAVFFHPYQEEKKIHHRFDFMEDDK